MWEVVKREQWTECALIVVGIMFLFLFSLLISVLLAWHKAHDDTFTFFFSLFIWWPVLLWTVKICAKWVLMYRIARKYAVLNMKMLFIWRIKIAMKVLDFGVRTSEILRSSYNAYKYRQTMAARAMGRTVWMPPHKNRPFTMPCHQTVWMMSKRVCKYVNWIIWSM